MIALVRDKAGTVKKVNEEIGRPNIHVVEGDLSSYANLKVRTGPRTTRL